VPAGAEIVLGDLIDGAGEWTIALQGADALVHFSAVNPYPNANWAESAGSMLHTFNAFVAAKRLGVRRVVFASSNHVMGQYKDKPVTANAPPDVKPTSPPSCGTPLNDAESLAKSGDAIAYAAAKLAGEQLCRALATEPRCGTSFVILRIGWCQPGANLPSTLSASGCPPEFQSKVEGAGSARAARDAAPAEDVDEAWFKNMWLSNGDFLRYFEAALSAPVVAGAPVLVNAMSRNTGMRWSLVETERALGVVARDNSRA